MTSAYSPVIKWSGSKRPVATQLAEYMPFDMGVYFEPFVGGGAMMPFAKSQRAFASDIIPELIDLWQHIKTEPLTVAAEYEERWNNLQAEGPDVYYRVRDSFNNTRNCFDFLFLTRTCVNGLIRYNDKGEFNNSFHLSRPGICPATLRELLLKWSRSIQKFEFLNVDYRECLAEVKAGDFVFLDPPYGGTKDRYTHTEFDFNAFYNELERLNRVGAKWMLTFDGVAGERTYQFAPPKDLYRQKFSVNTGTSAFTRVMNKQKDVIQESVYLNYEPVKSERDLFDELF